MSRRRCAAVVGIAVAVVLVCGLRPAIPQTSDAQLTAVRSKIAQLQRSLENLDRETLNVRKERERLDAELDLAKAKVDEIELMLTESRDEVLVLRQETDRLAADLHIKKEALGRHLEMLSLLGRPGPLQLMYDAMRGGELQEAIDTVAVLTSAQVRLIEEFNQLQRQHGHQLAELSQQMSKARTEARELIDRREKLEAVRSRVEARLKQLEKQRQNTDHQLADMRGRAQALERLLGIVRSRQDFEGKRNILRYRGALPWPAKGKIVRTFGKHYLPKYATYTVCNGLRLAVPSGAEVKAVFPGEVAYARHFKGYGNMVVVDHGNDVYSLVAGLATIHVKVNQRVALGKRLGLAPPPRDDGNLYLEIRVGEKPQDPRRWLQLEEDRSDS